MPSPIPPPSSKPKAQPSRRGRSTTSQPSNQGQSTQQPAAQTQRQTETGITRAMAPEDYEQIFHNQPTTQLLAAQRQFALERGSDPGIRRAAEMADPLYVTPFERLPPLVDAAIRDFLTSCPREYIIPEKKPANRR